MATAVQLRTRSDLWRRCVLDKPSSPSGIVYPVLLVPAILLSNLIFRGSEIRPSPPAGYAKFALYTLVALATVCFVTTFWPLQHELWSYVNVVFQLCPLFLLGPALATAVLGRPQADPTEAKAAADAHRSLSQLIIPVHFYGIILIVHGVLVNGESITPGSWAIAFDLLGSTITQFVILFATATQWPDVSTFFSRSVSLGFSHAFLAYAGDREVKKASEVVVKDVKKSN